MKVILISGKAQHGKDTAASLMEKHLTKDGHKVLITHYADLLKYICKEFLGWNGEKDEYGRRLLQTVGTDIVRKQYPDIWVDFLSKILKCLSDNWDFVIIPDCRFPNEISTVTEHGLEAVHLRVVRKNFESSLSEEQKTHPSETALDNTAPDYFIVNDGTTSELNVKIAKWIEENLYAKN